MTLPALVAAGQIMSAMAWLMVTYHYSPSVMRVAMRRPLPWDGAGCWAATMGMVQTAFTLRWLLLGVGDVADMSRTSLIVWFALYVMNAAVAVGILHTWRDTDLDDAKVRAHDALAAWSALAVVCIGAASWSL